MKILKDVSTVVTMKGEREMEWRTLRLHEEDHLLYLVLDRDKDDFDCVWLNEPEHIMDVSCEAGIILSDEFGHIGIHEIYQLDGKPVYDKCLLRYITQGDQPTGRIISSRELRKLLEK